jgi:hypothetical protein
MNIDGFPEHLHQYRNTLPDRRITDQEAQGALCEREGGQIKARLLNPTNWFARANELQSSLTLFSFLDHLFRHVSWTRSVV